MNTEQAVTQHYAHGALEQAILEALRTAGKDPERLSAAELAPVDEFHIGGRLATAEFARQLGARADMRLLDIGCGIGGPARYFAAECGCLVTGIDLSAEYAAVANALSARVGLADRVSCRQASALALPFAPASFDAATLLHVGMNVSDKVAMFRGVRRVLAPGGMLGIYDVMRTGPGEIELPVPWTSTPEASFVEEPAVYRALLDVAGFDLRQERNRRDFALESFAKMRARENAGKPSPLGLHIVMGPTAGRKVANMAAGIARGVIAPVEMILVAR